MTGASIAGRVIASTQTDRSAFAVVELRPGARVLALADRAHRPQTGATVSVHQLSGELWVVDPAPPQ